MTKSYTTIRHRIRLDTYTREYQCVVTNTALGLLVTIKQTKSFHSQNQENDKRPRSSRQRGSIQDDTSTHATVALMVAGLTEKVFDIINNTETE